VSKESIEGTIHMPFSIEGTRYFFFGRSECVRERLAASNASIERDELYFVSIEGTRWCFFLGFFFG